MIAIKDPRDVIYKSFEGHPGPCPKCGGELEKAYQPYMVLTRSGSRRDDSFMMSGDFGWFCQSCPIVVLNKTELSKILQKGKPDWIVGSEFSVAGIIDLDAVPANKRHMLLGDPGNPVPLIEFRAPKRADSTQRRRHRKK